MDVASPDAVGPVDDPFEDWVLEALDGLPEAFRVHLGGVAIVIQDEATPEQLAAVNARGLYGLYQGVARTAYGAENVPIPAKITIFRGPLTRRTMTWPRSARPSSTPSATRSRTISGSPTIASASWSGSGAGRSAYTDRARLRYRAAVTVTPVASIEGLAERADALLATALAEGRTPGIAAAITDRDRTLLVAYAGDAERASGTPVRPDHRFEIGSIGKTFTALALMQLADEGRLDPGDPVTRHLPWFRVPGDEPITLEHLLRHRSGITAGIDGSPDAFGQVWALRDLTPSARPGERFHYSNVGYKTLGLVLEAVDGRPYPEVIRRRILEPLGMSDTAPSITNEGRARLAVGHAWADDRIGHPGMPLVAATWLETDTADGSIASTAADMAIFARLLLRHGDGLVSTAAWERMVEPIPVDDGFGYGFALGTRVVGGRTFVGHTGGMVGYVAMLSIEPESGLGAIVLMNGYGSPGELSRLLIATARELRDGPDPREATPTEVGAGHQDELTGRWRAVARDDDVRPGHCRRATLDAHRRRVDRARVVGRRPPPRAAPCVGSVPAACGPRRGRPGCPRAVAWGHALRARRREPANAP